MVNGSVPASARTERTFSAGERIAVLLPLPLAGSLDYLVPEGVEVADGAFVEAPLGGRALAGVVWGDGGSDLPAGRLRAVRRVLPAPALPEVSRRFVDWVAAYTVQPPGAVLRMAMSVPAALVPERPARGVRLVAGAVAAPPGPARARVLELLADGTVWPTADLAREAGSGASVVRGLLAAGTLEVVELPVPSPAPADWRRPGRPLGPGQREAAEVLRVAVAGGFSVMVLDGLPGSGKTEVYFEAIAAALSGGRQALVLLPEIALGAQWRMRFAGRFGTAPREWHSDLPVSERRRTWRAVADGTADVVVGARSALFLPFPRLGLIVVDEEHDASFKQEDGVAYHARDMAVVRARLGGAACVLVSATPSLETVVNVQAGRYQGIALPTRPGGVAPPAVEAVDLCRERPAKGAFLSPPLRRALEETLAAGRQSLLFLNRRGYAPLTLCRACGHRLRCDACTAWLVEHRLAGRLQCHHCGFHAPLPTLCPACGASDSLTACGPGVERLAEEVAAALPAARTLLATSDTLTGPAAAADLVSRIERHEVDLIIGTQIVAKGYHFPLLTLVGVVDADIGLAGGDLRAAERTFQLLCQVGGRAGRAEPGRVLLQTTWPRQPVIEALVAGDRERFLAAEEADRRAAGMPPFGRLAALVVSGRDELAVDAAAAALARAAPEAEGVRVLGPAPAPLSLLRGRHRRRLLAIAPRAFPLSSFVRDWLARAVPGGAVRVQVDIDPQSFL